MSKENCPYCGHDFENRTNRYNGSFLSHFQPKWASQHIDDLFTVRCPNCGVAYVSESVKILGLVTKKYYLLVLMAIVVIVIVCSALGY